MTPATLCIATLLPGTASACLAQVQSPQPGSVPPRVFAPGVISGPASDAAATFTPDGRTVYFFRSNGEDYDILRSRLVDGAWSQPRIASFSGRWRDLEPALAPDGSYLIFASSRPIDGGGKPIDGHWGGKVHAGKGGHLWRVERTKSGWSKPVLLPATVNQWDSTFSPAIARDGSLYFMAATGKGGHFQLYCAPFKDGRYQPARLLPFSTGEWGGVDPAIAPDQSFIVFASNRPPTPTNGEDAFIAFRDNTGHWGKPIDLHPVINNQDGIVELRLGPDARTLYFTSGRVVAPVYPKTRAVSEQGLQDMQAWNNGNANIWKVDLSPWLRQYLMGSVHRDRDECPVAPSRLSRFSSRSSPASAARGKGEAVFAAGS